jgi:hypothetical protein
MRFRELAWGAFGFATMTQSDYLAPYQSLVTDAHFLRRLETDPSLDDFQRLRDFLTHYGVPWAPIDLANQYLTVWPRLKPYIQKLASKSLEVCDLNSEGPAIKEAYAYLQWPYCWGGDTVASKSLHFFNVDLFVMWDSNIQASYGKSFGPAGYLEFLQEMQNHMKESIADFKRLSLPGTPAEFLSAKLGYKGVRPLTKLIDDHNWVTITKGWPSTPPDWLSKLLSPN